MNISIDTVVAVTRWSRRTWWRRISEGTVKRLDKDSRGRAMLAAEDVQPHMLLALTPEDLAVLAQADDDIPEAQNDIGQLFVAAGHPEVGLFWIRQAAEKGLPDAMQFLGRAYASGIGIKRDDNLAIMWIAKAAALGHSIAQHQMGSLRKKNGARQR